MRYPLLAAAILALGACGGSDTPDGAAEATAFPAQPEQPETPPQGRFAPRNECIEQPGAKPFFVALEQAVRDRNADELLAITHAGVRLDLGGGGGLTTFRERLEASDSELWSQLDDILALGCAMGEGGNMVLPWYFAQDLDVEDPFSAMMVTAADVPLRSGPDPTSLAIGRVSWDTVTLLDGAQRGELVRVRTRAGEEGYVDTDNLRSLVDYRLFVAPKEGEWRIASFVSGD